jgi:hypothetical protein
VQAVVQVLAEVARLHERRELLVRRADDAHVDGFLLRRADLAHFLFLDRAQSFTCIGERQVRHFVEEQRAAVRGLEESVAIGLGAREGALAIAEELALHQVLGDRAAVDGDERLLAARAVEMDHARGELLAAAGLAVDENGRLALGKAVDQPAHLLHRGRIAQELIGARRLCLFWDLERLLHERAQLLERDRLGQVVERAGLERGNCILGAAEGGMTATGTSRPFWLMCSTTRKPSPSAGACR